MASNIQKAIGVNPFFAIAAPVKHTSKARPKPEPGTEKRKKVNLANEDAKMSPSGNPGNLKVERCDDVLPPLIKASSVTDEKGEPENYDVNTKQDGADVVTLDITYQPASARLNSSKKPDVALPQLLWRNQVQPRDGASPKFDHSPKITKSFRVKEFTQRPSDTIPSTVVDSKKFEEKLQEVRSVKCPKIVILDSVFSPSNQTMSPKKKYLKPLTKEQKNGFQDACISGSPADVLAILEKGEVLVNDALEHSWSGLQHACYLGRADNVKVLLEAGADPNFKRYDDMNALMSAACSKVGEDSDGPLACAKLLVEAGANLEAMHEKLITPLIFAVKLGHFRMVIYFLENGALPLLDHKDVNTRSALDWAAFLGKAKIVRVLLEHGAKVLDTNRFRQTPAEVALQKGFTCISDLIKIVQTTQWRPGKDPMLREVQNTESNLKLQEINKTRRLAMIKTYEDEHLGMILESLNLTHLAPLFEKHRISYLDFLRLKDTHLAEMGILDRSERQALCRVISETTPSIYTQDDPKVLRLRRTLTRPEAYCILIDNKQHWAYLADNLKELHRRIEEEPKMLIVGAETTSIGDLIRTVESIDQEVNQFLSATSDLDKLLLQSGGKAEIANEPETTTLVETKTHVVSSKRIAWYLLVGYAGAGLTYMAYKTWGFPVAAGAFKN